MRNSLPLNGFSGSSDWKTTLPVAALALFLAAGFAYTFFPGFMSPDSLSQFRQVLGLQKLANANPVIMVYLWRLLLHIHNHAGVLLAFHQTVYWLGIALFVCLAVQRLWMRLLLLLSMGLCPPLIILSLHLWKDVGVMCALSVAVATLLGYIRHPHWGWLIASVLALFFAAAVRVNGFIPVLPLLLILCYFSAIRFKQSRWQTAGLTAVGIVCLSLMYGAAMSLLNSGVKKTYLMGSLVVWDMVAISLAENQDLIPSYLYRSTTENIIPALATVNSTEANYPVYSVVSPNIPKVYRKQLVRDWLGLIADHPQAYLHHRAHVFGVMMGLGKEIYYPYHPGIDENELNIRFTHLTIEELNGYLHLFKILAKSLLYRPWIYALLALIVVTVAGRRFLNKRGNPHANLLAATVAFSGLVSAGSLLIIATAADYRYIIWTIFAAIQAVVILGADVRNSTQK